MSLPLNSPQSQDISDCDNGDVMRKMDFALCKYLQLFIRYYYFYYNKYKCEGKKK